MDIPQIKNAGLFANKNILIAEDNKANQLVLKKLFKKVSVDPVFVDNGKELVERYMENHGLWDLILMDCEMPVMDGYEATEQLRLYENEHQAHQCVVVGLSAHASEALKEKAISKGMNGYLTKPIDRDDLFETLLKYLSS